MNKIISIIGSPGSGKGTQIDLLANKLNIYPIKTGEMVRKLSLVDGETRHILEMGGLAQNDKVDAMIEKAIAKVGDSQTIVLDAFPRDIEQAYWLDKFLDKTKRKLNLVIFLEIPDGEAIERMGKRNRKYENKKNIFHRLDDYHNKTEKVINYYQDRGILVKVNGVGKIEEINKKLLKLLQKYEN